MTTINLKTKKGETLQNYKADKCKTTWQGTKKEGAMNLTKRDREILEFVKGYMKEYGTTPTIREIGEGVGLYSTSSVYSHFQRLITSGDIIPATDKSYRYTVKGMRYVEDD